MYRYEVNWLTPTGGLGVSRFHAQPAAASQANRQAWADGIRTFFDAIKSQFPSSVSWTFGSEIMDFNASDGVVAGYFNVTPPASLAGNSSSAELAGPVGCIVRWETNAVFNNRRVRGRTYLVPLSRAAYDAQGTIQGPSITQIQTAANVYVANTQGGAIIPHVYSPEKDDPDGHPGFISEIVAAVVPDLACVMRSRRD